MKGRNRRRRSVWLRLALGVAVTVAAHAVDGGSAKAATISAAADAPAPSATVLAGFTSQEYPAFFKLADDGRKVSLAGIALEMTCTSGDQWVLQDAFIGIRISPNGRLHASSTEAPTSDADGSTQSASDSLSARLNRSKTQLSGVWQLTVHYTYTDGASDACDSGPVRFSATS
jgi:hypothetical protein